MGKLGDSLDFSWPRKLLCLLLLQMSIWGSDAFVVIGPAEPIIAMLGADTVLPCRVSPVMSVENMELRWSRSQFSEAVYVYQDGKEQVGEQLVDFKGRTELVKDYITEGRAAVKIYSLQVSDNGIYKCFFKKGNDSEEANLELKVIGLGSGPHIRIVGPEEDGIKVTCTGKGWFPQPEVQWKDETGKRIPSLSEDETPDNDGLFHMEASLIVRDSSRRTVSCSMKNPVFGEERVETISIPEPFFPRTSPWKTAFIVTLLMLGVSMGAVGVLIRKHQEKKRRLYEVEKEKEEECQTTESLETDLARRKKLYRHDWEKTYLYGDWRKEYFDAELLEEKIESLEQKNKSLEEKIEKLRAEIDERKAQFQIDWRNSSLYPDWRKALFKAGEVLLDADTAHCNLILSEDRRCVTWEENPQERPDNRQRFYSLPCVLGQQHFTSGSCYWEVEVDESRAWDLGVCRDNVMRKGRVVIKPENGFWVIRFYKDEYWALTAPETQLTLRNRTTRVCIFLEYERGCISFYDMTDNSHIHTFSQCSFSGSLRPLFRLWSSDPGQLTICPVQSNTN